MKRMKAIMITARLWILTAGAFGVGCLVYSLVVEYLPFWTGVLGFIIALAGSFPAFLIVLIVLHFIRKQPISTFQKNINLFFTGALLCLLYGVGAGILLGGSSDLFYTGGIAAGALLACFLCAILFSRVFLHAFFTVTHHIINQKQIQKWKQIPMQGSILKHPKILLTKFSGNQLLPGY